MSISKQDIKDLDFVDAEELIADGSTNFRSGDTVVSTVSATKTINLSGTLLINGDEPVEPNNKVVLTGTTGADGIYTVATVPSDTSVTVVESINDSTGGAAAFMFPSGATQIGVDPTNLTWTTKDVLQGVLEDITSGGEVNTASNIGTSGVGVYAQKAAVDLQFKNVKAASTKISVTDNPTPHTIDLDVVPGNISHTAISDIGSNSHTVIDSHIASISNPHSVTKTQVGLSAVTNDAQLKRAASDFGTFAEKVVPASVDILLVEDSADSGNKKKIQLGNLPYSSALPDHYIDSLGLTRNASYPTSRIDIALGVCRSDDDTTDIISSGIITINLAASGVNGLDTGSEASGIWYYIWLIYNPTTFTVAGLFSTSLTSPTLPNGYTKKRRIGSTYNNGSSNFRLWTQTINDGRVREYQYDEEANTNLLALNAGTATTFTDVNCSSWIPRSTTYGLFALSFSSNNAYYYFLIRANGSSQASPVHFQCGGASGLSVGGGSSNMYCRADANGIIEYKNSNTLCVASIWVVGYKEVV